MFVFFALFNDKYKQKLLLRMSFGLNAQQLDKQYQNFVTNQVIRGNRVVANSIYTNNLVVGSQRLGTAGPMVNGSITVSNTTVTSNTHVLFSRSTPGGTMGNVACTVSPGSGFTLISSSGTESSYFSYLLVD